MPAAMNLSNMMSDSLDYTIRLLTTLRLAEASRRSGGGLYASGIMSCLPSDIIEGSASLCQGLRGHQSRDINIDYRGTISENALFYRMLGVSHYDFNQVRVLGTDSCR